MNTARLLKYVWPFFNIMNKMLNRALAIIITHGYTELTEFFPAPNGSGTKKVGLAILITNRK